MIQERFRTEVVLIVDVPKAQDGKSNNAYTSRIVFANVETFRSVTDVAYNLMERFVVLLEISFGY